MLKTENETEEQKIWICFGPFLSNHESFIKIFEKYGYWH
jgi:hypothetical protein